MFLDTHFYFLRWCSKKRFENTLIVYGALLVTSRNTVTIIQYKDINKLVVKPGDALWPEQFQRFHCSVYHPSRKEQTELQL